MADGVVPSPNIWDSPEVYELENLAFDPDGAVWEAMASVRSWAGADVLDIGCGSGFHLPIFARTARSTLGIEPHPPLVAAARRRVRSGNIPVHRGHGISPLLQGEGGSPPEVRDGTAQELPVADASIDVAHARWAYFFGPGCEPGLAELSRVMRRAGVAFILDNDATLSTFGSWFRRWLPRYDPAAVERFWARQGFTRVPILTRWEFTSPEDLARVVRIEFSPEHADRVLAELHDTHGPATTTVDYAVNLFWRRY